MKVIYSILAVYMMVVFLMPCTDTNEELSFHNQNNAQEVTHTDSHDHQDSADMCSPFCFCGCCGMVSGIVLQWHPYALVTAHTFELFRAEEYYKPIFVPRYVGKIWQPPKINA